MVSSFLRQAFVAGLPLSASVFSGSSSRQSDTLCKSRPRAARRIAVRAGSESTPEVNVADTPGNSAIASLTDIHELIELAKEFDLADLRLENNGVTIELTMPGGRGFKDGKLQDAPTPAVAPATAESPPMQAFPEVGGVDSDADQESEAMEYETPSVPSMISDDDVPSKQEADENGAFPSDFYVKSNRVGFFYQGGKNKPPLVNVDDHVKFNQPVCIIEQLGQQYVYLSEVSGTVVKIFVENGDPVEYGSKVMLIRPD